MIRRLAAFFAFLLTLFLLLSIGTLLLSQSEMGSRIVLNTVKTFIPGKLTFGEVHGILSQHLIIENLSYQNKKIEIAWQKLDLQWQPQQLFHHTLLIQNITFTGLHLKKWPLDFHTAQQSETSSFLKKITLQHFLLNDFSANLDFYLPQSINNPLQKIKLNAEGQLDFIAPENIIATIKIYAAHDLANVTILNTGEHQKIQWSIQLPEIKAWIQGATGHVVSEGLLDNHQINATLEAKNITYQQHVFNAIKLSLHGDDQHPSLTLSASQPTRKLSAAIEGHYQNKQWRGQLSQLQFYDKAWGQWKQYQPASFSFMNNHFLLHAFALRSPSADYRLDAEISPAGFTLKQKGSYTLSPLRLQLISPEMLVTSNYKTLNFSGRLLSGNGQIQFSGNTAFTQNAPLFVKAQGKNFLAANTSQYQVSVSPDVTFSGTPSGWKLQGRLTIPHAVIHLPDTNKEVVTLPADVKFVHPPAINDNQTDFLGTLSSDLFLDIPTPIEINAEGLSAILKGNLTLKNTPQTLPTATGTLTLVKGDYKIYGQTLHIRNGKLLFHQSLVNNPSLDIQAVKKIDIQNVGAFQAPNIATQTSTFNSSDTPPATHLPAVVTLGVNASGTLENPTLSLFSEPPVLSKADILSYLLLGHPANALSLTDANFLLETSSTMKLNLGDLGQITTQLQNAFGIDEIKIGSTNYIDPTTHTLQQTTSLMLKKTLSPRFYLTYSVGLFDPINIFTLHYILSKRWSLQTTSTSFANGADLIYSVDRN